MKNLIFGALIFLSGCVDYGADSYSQNASASAYQPADPVVPTVPDAQAEDAVATFDACLAIQAAQIDDHISSASVIATALEGDCPKYWPAVIRVHIGGLVQSAASEVQSDMENEQSAQYGYALQAVLYERTHSDEFASSTKPQH